MNSFLSRMNAVLQPCCGRRLGVWGMLSPVRGLFMIC